MTARRWLIGVGSGALLAAAGLAALSHWLGSDDFRQRVQVLISDAVGAPVTMERIRLDLRPWPAVGVVGLAVAPTEARAVRQGARPAARAAPPITVGRIALQPDYGELLAGRLRLAVLHVDDAVLPQGTLLALSVLHADRPGADAPGSRPDALPDATLLPREVRLNRLGWVSLEGVRHTVDADLALSPDGWPQRLGLQVLEGPYRQTALQLDRQAASGDDPPAGTRRWQLSARVGGGTVEGPVRWSPLPAEKGAAIDRPAVWQVQADLVTRQVEVSALTVPSRTLTGRLQATTALSARVDPAAGSDALLRGLRTQTRFQIDAAVLHGIDLARAVTTVGLSRGGETSLDTLAGQVTTRGAAIELQNLVATSGVLAATGDVAISPARALSGRVRVDMTRGAGGGAMGVPLAVGGTLDDPSVTLTRSALVGAAIGTALMPGVGTGAGANLGDRLGEGIKGLFGGGQDEPRPAPRR
jgi:hypothetical protein